MNTLIKNNIYSVGVRNPGLKVFDVVMETKYGTTYNSFLVQGRNKIALIDTAHVDFYKEFIENIEEITPIEKIDYLIVNHCEPDHTGSIAKLLAINPNIQIYCSAASSNFLKNITNINDLNIHIVVDQETLDLGDKTLKFISAPFLHWPDSIFTYAVEDKIVFTCDFLGSHFCGDGLFDREVGDKEAYAKEFKNYYDAIFGPFSTYVASGLTKLKALEFDLVGTSHGPLLTADCLLNDSIKNYSEWCAKKLEVNYIPIFYCSAYGYTKKLAEAIASGIEKEGSRKTKLFNVIEHDMCDLQSIMNAAEAVCFGTPTINRNALPPIYGLLIGVDVVGLKNKPALVFGSFGWSGEGVPIITTLISKLGFKTFNDGFKKCFLPTEADLNEAELLGTSFADSLIKK